jgi:branched-chain amino acid transport system substrate-binding protein
MTFNFSKEVQMSKATKLFALLAVLLLAAALAWSSSGPGEKAGKVIKIGYTAPFTGSAAEFGTNGWRGVQLALEEINAAGLKVKGETYKIEIVRYDSKCEPTEAVANMRKLALEDKVLGVLGDHCSSCCRGIAPLATEYKIPSITIECAADNVTNPGQEYYFRMRPSMGLMAPLAAPKILKLTNAKKVGYLGINDDYGRSFVQSFKNNFTGVSTVAEIYFERGNTDFMAFLNQIKQAKPDIVLYVGVAAEGAMILKQAQEIGIIPGIKFIGSEEMGEMELMSLAGPDAVNGTYAVALWGAVDEAFAKKVQEKFNAPMHYAIIFAYDALKVMADAIVRAQSLDTAAIKDALLATDYKGLEGQIKFETFEGFRNQGRYTPSFIQWKDGKRVAM